MKVIFRHLFLIILLIFFSLNTLKANTYRVGILHFPPYFIYEEDKELSGTLLKLMKKVLNRTGIEYSVQGFPPSRLYNNLKVGNVDIWLGIKGVKAYDKEVLYSKASPAAIDLRIFTRGDVIIPSKKKSLNGKGIIVIRGYSYGGLIDYLKNPINEIKIYPTNNHIQAIRMLKAKRANYLLDYRRPANWTGKALSSDLTDKSLKKINLYFIVSKKSKDHVKLMNMIETAYSIIK
ncbi:MAG: transporter substrate-binding domain-containing protein [Deltaproteobacteria bacterium]|nr:transporter substrate-binding domain-containing protein [Deltaproteobacteria bacterium]